MKSFLSLLTFLCMVTFSYGQSSRHTGFSSATFEGVKTEDGNLFYTTYRGQAKKDTLYSYVIQIFNKDLQQITKERVPTKYNSEVQDVEAHNGGLLFYIQSAEMGLIYCYNEKGEKLWQKELERDKDKYNRAVIKSLGQQGFAIIRPDKEDDDGFRVTLYDNQMNQKWSQGQYPEKGNIDYSEVQVAGDKIAVLASYQRSLFSNKFEKTIYVYSATDGSLMYQYMVGSDENGQHPENFVLNPDGSTFIVGFVPGFGNKSPTHLFYTALSSSGSQLYNQRFSISDELKPRLDSIRAKENFGLRQPPMINIENIRKTGNGYQVIGELYNYVPQPISQPSSGVTVGTSGKGTLYIMDYVIMEISETGKLEKVRNLGKPHKRVKAENHMVENEDYADDYYEGFNLFSYRHMAEKNGVPVMVSMNWHHNTPYFGYTSLDVNHENILNRTYLSKSVGERDYGEVTEYTFRKESAQKPLETYHYNVLPYAQPGKLLFYDYEGGELAMQVMDLDPQMPEATDGKLSFTGIPATEFKGLMPIENDGYYTFYQSEKAAENTNLYIYHRLDKNMNTTGRSVLQVPQSVSFAGNVDNGDGQVIVFQDRQERAWYLYAINKQGELTANNKIALDETANQVPTGNLLLEPATDGFYMVQPYVDTAAELGGYQVIRLNPNQQVRWSWSQEAADSNQVLQLTSTGAGNGIFAVIHNQHHYRDYKQVTNKLMAIDDQTGTLLFEHDLFDGQDAGFPEYVKIGADKSVVTSGMYFKGKDFSEVNSAGLFFLKLSADGSKTFYTKTPWETVETAIKEGTETDFLISGKTKVLIEDMILMPDGSYRVIGELYRKSLGTTGLGFMLGDDLKDRAFSIFDFVVFDYSKSGQLGKTYRIPKEEQNIELSGSISRQRGLGLSLLMRRYNMFSYLKTMQDGEQPHLLFTTVKDRKKMLYNAPVAHTADSDFPSAPAEYTLPKKAPDQMSKLEQLESKLEKFGQDMEEAVSGTQLSLNSFRDPYKGFAVAVPREVLVYYYNPETRTLNLKLEKVE